MSTIFDLIQIRENILSRILGISSTDILNPYQDSNASFEGIKIVTRLKSMINSIQDQVISDNGDAVDYSKLKESKIYAEFRSTLTPQLHNFNPNTLQTNAQRLMFWINLYNVLMIDSVIQNEVKVSVTEGFAGVMRFFRQAAYDIGGYRTTLDDIEHGILRENRGNPYIPGPQFGINDPRKTWGLTPMEPRIHFALNCASKSCPPIGIYTVDQIDTQLDIAARNFINQDVVFDPKSNTLNLSRIFKWFAEDFGGRKGMLKFIELYIPIQTRKLMRGKHETLKLKYKPYNWGLNIIG